MSEYTNDPFGDVPIPMPSLTPPASLGGATANIKNTWNNTSFIVTSTGACPLCGTDPTQLLDDIGCLACIRKAVAWAFRMSQCGGLVGLVEEAEEK